MYSKSSAPMIVPVTELRRKFGEITRTLVQHEAIILTRDGKPFATLRSTREAKMELLRETFGAWKGTKLDDNDLWAEILKRKSRKRPLTL